MELNWPWCERCGKPVAFLSTKQDVWTGAIVYTVECHDEVSVQYAFGIDTHDTRLIGTTCPGT